jgi:hypothetical protein
MTPIGKGIIMRKRLMDQEPSTADDQWLNLESLAQAEISSEDDEYPIESAIHPDNKRGWRALHPGEQVIRFIFDESRPIRRIRLVFHEERQGRTQEFSLAWSGENETALRELLRQQYNFNPPHNIREVEDYQVNLQGVKVIELRIRPDISGGIILATLDLIQIA